MNELARIRDTFNTVKYPSNVSPFAQPHLKVQTLSTDATLKQMFSLEHAYEASNADGQNKGEVRCVTRYGPLLNTGVREHPGAAATPLTQERGSP